MELVCMKKMLMLVPLLLPATLLAQEFYATKPATIECVVEAANRQGVPANVLLAISSIESGRNGQLVKNKNGSLDIGHFQINTVHWGKNGIITRHGINKEDVQWSGCYNAELAAWLLKQSLEENTNQNFWVKAANYHSKNAKFNAIYRKKLMSLSVQWGRYLESQYSNTLRVNR